MHILKSLNNQLSYMTILVARRGIEPLASAYETEMLPLHHLANYLIFNYLAS